LASALCLLTVLAAHGGTYHVAPPAAGGDDGNGGTAWSDAKATIGAAVTTATAAAGGPHLILVSNGLYNISATIAITTNITVQGLSRTETIVRRDAVGIAEPRFGIFTLTHAGAVVSTLTATNGYAANSTHGSGAYVAPGMVTNCTITGCAGNRGSAVYVALGGLVTDSTVEYCVDAGNSMGAPVRTIAGTLDRCIVRNNSSGTGAGATGIWIAGNGTVIRNCVVSNNVPKAAAPDQKAVHEYSNYDTVIDNCLIVHNQGPGVEVRYLAKVRNCTIANNAGTLPQGNGLYVVSGAGVQIQNCIIYNNGVGSYKSTHQNVYMGAGTIEYSCMTPPIVGTGNTAADPRFTDALAGDFSLMPGSPCIDSASNHVDVVTDINGTGRPIDGDGVGAADQDMGCYEMPDRDTGALRCGFTASLHEGVGSLSATFAAYVAGSDTTITSYDWDFGDGASGSGAAPSHTYSPGFYTVSLVVSNVGLERAEAVATNDIRVGPSAAYVWSGGLDDPPYESWTKAAHDIQSAVDVVISTGVQAIVVYVTNDTYALPSTLVLTKKIEIRGVDNPILKGSAAANGAGVRAVYAGHSGVILSGLVVTNGGYNDGHGSGIYSLGATITNCVVTECAGNRDSAVYMVGGLLTHSTIANNRDVGNYLGVPGPRLTGGATIEYCTINGNTAGSESEANSGAAALWLEANTTARNCVITNNFAKTAILVNHAVRISGAGALLQGCQITDNTTRGVKMTAAGTVESCTISRNTVYGDTGNAIQMSAGTVLNSILWDNGPDNTKNLDKTGGTVEFTDVNPADAGTGNLNVDPSMTAPAGGDFRLGPTSQCIDKGTNQVAWMNTAVDLDGSNRIINVIVDMGAYEAPEPGAGPLSCDFSAPATEGFTNFQAVFTATLAGGNTNIDYYVWTFGDGNTEDGAAKEVVTNLYTTPGAYDVRLVVMNDASEWATNTKAAYIYAPPDIAYAATNGGHVTPFDSWTKAATNMQDSIDVARVIGPRSTLVLLSNGTFEVSGQTEISKGITVRSLSGRSQTLVKATGISFNMFWVHDVDAVLDGITITNGQGASYNPGAVLMDGTGGTVQNCLIVGSRGQRSGVIRMSSGMVTNCIIRDNFDIGNYLNCGGITMSGGTVVDSEIVDNHAGTPVNAVGGVKMAGGELRNCVISGNACGDVVNAYAGGVYMAIGTELVRNCLISGNQGRGLRIVRGDVENCTIARNSGVGVEMSGGTVTNTIIASNNIGAGDITGAPLVFGYSCSPDLAHDPGGSGNINTDPSFRNVGSGYGTNNVGGDFRLSTSSLCIDGAVVQPWMTGAFGLGGNIRSLDDGPDMGAYETFVPPKGTIILLR